MLFKRLVCVIILLAFGLTSVIPLSAYSQNIPNTPANILSLTPAFHPVMIQGMRVHPDNPLQFDFIVDTGDASVDINGSQFKQETTKLIKYFLASLTVPEKEMWVNLSPYEKDRIIANGLGTTELGADMLSQDYILKQLTSSLIYPDSTTGRSFWEKVYAKTRESFGRTDIPVNTFNKVWIVPDKAVVYERGNTVYIAESHLKVMLEQDYLALSKRKLPQGSSSNALASQVVRQVVLPELEKEVNQGRNFANLRQIYNAMILAVWFKTNLQKSLLGRVYTDKNKTAGVDAADKAFRQKIYERYVRSFKRGVYNYIREENDPVTGDVIPRKYFSGGLMMSFDHAMLEDIKTGPVPPAVKQVRGRRVDVRTRITADQASLAGSGNTRDNSMLTESEKVLSVIKSLAQGDLFSDENRGLLTKSLSPALVERIDGILKSPAGREAVLRTTHNQMLFFIKLAGLITGPPQGGLSAVFEQFTDYFEHVLSQSSKLSEQEQKFLESAIQAYRFGYAHGGASYIDKSVLELLDGPTRALREKIDKLPDTLLDEIQGPGVKLPLMAQGITSFVFATPDGNNIIKYVKTLGSVAADVPPDDHRFPQQSWAHDYGVNNQGQLHPVLWEDIELFETYGEMGLPGRVYIAQEAYKRLNAFEKERLRRYEEIGIVRRIPQPVVITPEYPPGSPIFDQQKVDKISISVLLAYPLIASLKDKFIDVLQDKDPHLSHADRLKEALKWMDATFKFIEELWGQGILQTDATFFNIGVQTLGDDGQQLAVLDPHIWSTDFPSGQPIGATEQNIREYLDNTKAGSYWALMQIQQKFFQEDPRFFMELFSHFDQRSREVLTFENFQKHWRPFSSNIVSVFQKGILYSHPLFQKFLEAARGEYYPDLNEQPLTVQGSVNLKAGIKSYRDQRILVVFNPSDANSGDGKEWGKIQIGQVMDIQNDAIYFFKELLTGEVYVRTGGQLQEANGFLVGLAPYRMHLFTMEEKRGPLPAYHGEGPVGWKFTDVILSVGLTNYVLPEFPASMILQIRNDFPLHLLDKQNAYVEYRGKGGAIERYPLELIADNNGNFVLGEMSFFPQPGIYPFEITLHVNGDILKYRGVQKVEKPDNQKWQNQPLIIPVDENLFLGNAAAAARPKLLKERGIGAVVNASERDLRPVYYDNPQGIEYSQFGSEDMSYNFIPDRVLWEAAKWIHQQISSGKSVFVHCHAGIGRSSSLLIAYLFLFKYPDKSFDDVVDMVREKATQAGHYIYPHIDLAKTLEKLREDKRRDIEYFLGHSYQPTVQVGDIQSVSFAPEGEFREGRSYDANVDQPLLIRAKVKYGGTQPPYGVFVHTNLNNNGKDGENILMKYNPGNRLYEAWITPQRTGEHFWLTLFALPHSNDHPFKLIENRRWEDQRTWGGKNIYFRTKPSSPQANISTQGETIMLNDIPDGEGRVSLFKAGVPGTTVLTNPAMVHTPGGIDLDPSMLNLQTKRYGKGVAFSVVGDSAMQVNGFTPVIIRITPMSSPLLSDSG